MRHLIFILFAILSFNFFGQETKERTSNFTILTKNGLNKTWARLDYGSVDYISSLSSYAPGLQLRFENRKKYSGFNTSISSGLFPTGVRYNDFDRTDIPEEFFEFEGPNYTPYINFDIGLSFFYPVHPRIELFSSLNVGVSSFINNKTYNRFEFNSDNYSKHVSLSIKPRLNSSVFFQGELGFLYRLRNNKSLITSFFVEQFYNDKLITGRYSMSLSRNDRVNYGYPRWYIVNKGFTYGLKLGYQFNSSTDKKEKKSIPIRISSRAGLFLSRNSMGKSERKHFQPYNGKSWLYGVDLELDIKESVFIDFGIAHEKYSEYSKLYYYNENKYYDRLFTITKFYAGIGRRFYFQNGEKELISLQAGASLGFRAPNNNYYGKSQSVIVNNGDLKYRNFRARGVLKSKTISTIYGELTKNINISKKFSLNLSYRFDIGLYSIYENQITYNETKYHPVNDYDGNDIEYKNLGEETIKVKGTSQTLSIGFGYKF